MEKKNIKTYRCTIYFFIELWPQVRIVFPKGEIQYVYQGTIGVGAKREHVDTFATRSVGAKSHRGDDYDARQVDSI